MAYNTTHFTQFYDKEAPEAGRPLVAGMDADIDRSATLPPRSTGFGNLRSVVALHSTLRGLLTKGSRAGLLSRRRLGL